MSWKPEVGQGVTNLHKIRKEDANYMEVCKYFFTDRVDFLNKLPEETLSGKNLYIYF